MLIFVHDQNYVNTKFWNQENQDQSQRKITVILSLLHTPHLFVIWACRHRVSENNRKTVRKAHSQVIINFSWVKSTKWREIWESCNHFLLTRRYIYNSGINAKRIGHRTSYTQICRGHHCDHMCYCAVVEGLLINLNNES